MQELREKNGAQSNTGIRRWGKLDSREEKGKITLGSGAEGGLVRPERGEIWPGGGQREKGERGIPTTPGSGGRRALEARQARGAGQLTIGQGFRIKGGIVFERTPEQRQARGKSLAKPIRGLRSQLNCCTPFSCCRAPSWGGRGFWQEKSAQ